MATAQNVAAYILQKRGTMTSMKLQKLVYYCQAWSLVWDEKPLFSDRIEAWASGPVVRSLYEHHRGLFTISNIGGKPDSLSDIEKETVDAVLSFYGDKSSQWLSDLTHQEEPWLKARKGLGPMDRGNREITIDSMMEYYSSLQ